MNRQLHKKSIKAFFNSTSHFDFFQNDGRQARKGVVYTLTDAGKIVFGIDSVPDAIAALFPNQNSKRNAEFKQDGLLMLKIQQLTIA